MLARSVLTAFTIAITSLSFLENGKACDPVPGTLVASIAERSWESPVIAVGTITAFSADEWPQDLTVEVESYLKGSGSNIITVTGLNAGHSCSDFVSVGGRHIFFLRQIGETYDAIYDGAFGSVRTASDENINTITSSLAAAGPWAASGEESDGWRQNTWLRDFQIPDPNSPWIWHPDLGWIAAQGTPDSIWMWSDGLGWVWTSPDAYPYFYQAETGDWLWYKRATPDFQGNFPTGIERWFVRLSSGEWFSLGIAPMWW